MSRRRKIAISFVVLITLAWAIGFGAFLSLQGFPGLLELARHGARARVEYWAVWLAGTAAGAAIVIALWRGARTGTRSSRERRWEALFIVAGAAVWTALMLAALALEMIAYPPGEFGAALEPYPTQSRLLLIGGWLIGAVVAAGLLIGLRREAKPPMSPPP